jgi:hypothetical protein
LKDVVISQSSFCRFKSEASSVFFSFIFKNENAPEKAVNATGLISSACRAQAIFSRTHFSSLKKSFAKLLCEKMERCELISMKKSAISS